MCERSRSRPRARPGEGKGKGKATTKGKGQWPGSALPDFTARRLERPIGIEMRLVSDPRDRTLAFYK